MSFKYFFLACLTCFISGLPFGTSEAQQLVLKERQVININSDWQYLEKNYESYEDLAGQTGWTDISLPHTWNRWDATDLLPGYRRDASWYRKDLFLKDYGKARYIIHFEGANITTEIYVNGQKAGKHIGGYVGFKTDITKYIERGQLNTIAVRVDNSYNPEIIPSQKADFFIYGGLTRDVWLNVFPETNFKHIAAFTPRISAECASTELEIEFNRDDLISDRFIIHSKIIEQRSGKTVAEIEEKASDVLGKKRLIFPEIKNPQLWSPADPFLYTITTRLLEKGEVKDELSETIGYRWFEFKDHGAFFLNGERLLLRGTHRHEEHAGFGAAMSNEMHRRDIEQMKEIGVNFLRLGHYPQDPEIYRACNELGILVWDELPWCRGGKGNAAWEANTKRLFREQIRQNINHPSIVFWSLGNEIFWLPDFPDGDREEDLNAFVKELHDEAHRLDPGRLTAIRKYYAGADLVDVFSPSIWSGWYAGVYTNYGQTLTENQKKYPRFLHMEYGGSSHVGRHTENPVTGDGMLNDSDWAEVANQVNVKNIAKSGDWTENYIVDLFDWYLGVSETQENFAGNAQWAFKDFGTPLRPENAIPYLNQKGLVDRSGKPKDAFYVFKSYWSDEPFTYIESHTWTERRGPKGKAREVSVFSNCEQVELFHNGKSLGVKKRSVGKFPACGLSWQVNFSKGKNELIAKGLQAEQVITDDVLEVNYTFEKAANPDKIVLRHKLLPNGNYLIEALMTDKDGKRVLNYEKPIYFSKDGAGRLLKNYGTPTRSQALQMANGYAAIELEPAEEGKATIEVRNQDFKGSYLTLNFSQTEKKTQALILTQDFAYDAKDKNKIKGKYKTKSTLKVPQNLAGQNKWIMFEGPVLENDKIAYRYYADARHRFDIYGKTVNDLVMDTVSWKYHDIMDWGSDILKVGNSLGIGSPAIYYRDSLYTLSDCEEKTLEVLSETGNQSTIRTIFKGLRIEEHRFDLIQDWTLRAGEAWSEITLRVKDQQLPAGMYFASGIVKHLPEIKQGTGGRSFYAMNWGKQSYHKENMGMALVVPQMYQPKAIEDALSHAYIFTDAKQEVSYRFLAAWERDVSGVKNAQEFEDLVKRAGK